MTDDALKDLEPAITLLRRANRVLVTSHVNADGDAIGSSLALARALTAIGKDARVILNDFASKYHFLDGVDRVETLSAPFPEGIFADRDLGVLLDASDPERAGVLEPIFARKRFPLLCVDHHLGDRRPDYDAHVLRPHEASTASIVLDIVDGLGVELSREIAEPLFVGLATDTGWFRFSNTSPEVLRDAARLVDAGLEPEAIFSAVYEGHSLARLRLQTIVLDRVRVEGGGRFLWSALDAATIRASGVPRSDFEGFIDPLRSVETSRVVAFLTENEANVWKASLRARGDANVQRVASEFGGGGHAKAAGCALQGSLDEAIATLRRAVLAELERLDDAADAASAS